MANFEPIALQNTFDLLIRYNGTINLLLGSISVDLLINNCANIGKMKFLTKISLKRCLFVDQ